MTKVKFGGDDTTLLTAFHEPSEERYENILRVWDLSKSEAPKVAHKLRVELVAEGAFTFGFCAHGNTVAWKNQIGAVFIADLNTSAIEDAHLAHQDLHITYVDFSRAFNTVPHDGEACTNPSGIP